MKVAAWSWVLTDLLWDTFKEVSFYYGLIRGLWLLCPNSIFHDCIKSSTTLLIDKTAMGLVRIASEIFAHLMLAWRVLARWWVLQTSWILEGRLRDISVQKRVALLCGTETSVDGPLDNVLGLLWMCVVVLWPWVVDRVEIGVWLPAIGARVKHGFGPWASLHFGEVVDKPPLLQRCALDWLRRCFYSWGWSVKEADFLEMSLHSLFFVRWKFWTFCNKLKSWWFIFSHVNFYFVISRSQCQFLLCSKDIIFLFLFIHLFYIDLH